MGEVKQIKIINRTYYFYSDMINLKKSKKRVFLKKKSYKNIGIYNIVYITITIKKLMIMKVFTG